MFRSLLRPRKDAQSSETAPLLAARDRRSPRHGDHQSASDDYVDHGGDEDEDEHDEGEDEDEDEDEDGDNGINERLRRDGPLLPVFSAEFLGTSGPGRVGDWY